MTQVMTWLAIGVGVPVPVPVPQVSIITPKDIIMAVLAFGLGLLLFFFRNTLSQLSANVKSLIEIQAVRIDNLEKTQKENRARIIEVEKDLDRLKESLPDKDTALRELVAEAKEELNKLALDIAKVGVTMGDCQQRVEMMQMSIAKVETALKESSADAREQRDLLLSIKGELQAILE